MAVSVRNLKIGSGLFTVVILLLVLDLQFPPDRSLANRFGIAAIEFYQHHVRGLLAGSVKCRLAPSCSRFALRTLAERNSLSALILIVDRLRDCADAVPSGLVGSPGAQTLNQVNASGDKGLKLLLQQQPSPDAACAACGAGIGGLTLFLLAWVAAGIAICIWVARDAKNRGMENPLLWVFLVLFLSFIGIIIYLFSRPSGNLVSCQSCRAMKLQPTKNCPHCGNPDERLRSNQPRVTQKMIEVHREVINHHTGAQGSPVAYPPQANPAPQGSLPASTGTIFCGNCGTQLAAESSFCEDCGTKVE